MQITAAPRSAPFSCWKSWECKGNSYSMHMRLRGSLHIAHCRCSESNELGNGFRRHCTRWRERSKFGLRLEAFLNQHAQLRDERYYQNTIGRSINPEVTNAAKARSATHLSCSSRRLGIDYLRVATRRHGDVDVKQSTFAEKWDTRLSLSVVNLNWLILHMRTSFISN